MTSTLRAAALTAVPGGSVYRVETDAGDGTYEAHMTKADGSLVTVKFDKNLKVTRSRPGWAPVTRPRLGRAPAVAASPAAPPAPPLAPLRLLAARDPPPTG